MTAEQSGWNHKDPKSAIQNSVKGLLGETTEEILRESFEDSIRARIATGQETGSPKGSGFLDFNSEEDTKIAKEAVGDSEIDGNKVPCSGPSLPVKVALVGERGGFGGRGQGGFGGRGGF